MPRNETDDNNKAFRIGLLSYQVRDVAVMLNDLAGSTFYFDDEVDSKLQTAVDELENVVSVLKEQLKTDNKL